MHLQLQLETDAASSLRAALSGTRPDDTARRLLDAAAARRIVLRPLHPAVSEGALGRYFVAELPARGAEDPEALRAHFAALPGVSAAYLKPGAVLA